MFAVHTRIPLNLERSLPTGLLGLLGAILGGLASGYLITHPEPSLWWRTEALVVTVVSAGIVFSAYLLAYSEYESEDLWAILRWSLVGAVGGAVLTGGIYMHQTMEQAPPPGAAFLFEMVTLFGTGVGLGFGVSRRSLLKQRTQTPFGNADPADSGTFWTVLSLLAGNEELDPLRRRWVVIASVADTETLDIPVDVLVRRLARGEVTAFPNDETSVEALLFEETLPTLAENDLVKIDRGIGRVAYTGPAAIVEFFGGND